MVGEPLEGDELHFRRLCLELAASDTLGLVPQHPSEALQLISQESALSPERRASRDELLHLLLAAISDGPTDIVALTSPSKGQPLANGRSWLARQAADTLDDLTGLEHMTIRFCGEEVAGWAEAVDRAVARDGEDILVIIDGFGDQNSRTALSRLAHTATLRLLVTTQTPEAEVWWNMDMGLAEMGLARQVRCIAVGPLSSDDSAQLIANTVEHVCDSPHNEHQPDGGCLPEALGPLLAFPLVSCCCGDVTALRLAGSCLGAQIVREGSCSPASVRTAFSTVSVELDELQERLTAAGLGVSVRLPALALMSFERACRRVSPVQRHSMERMLQVYGRERRLRFHSSFPFAINACTAGGSSPVEVFAEHGLVDVCSDGHVILCREACQALQAARMAV